VARHARTLQIIQEAHDILEAFHPMTLRQIHYQLVSRQVTENTPSAYKGLSRHLAYARRDGLIPWEWMEDRLRVVRNAGDGWESVDEYWRFQVRQLEDGYSRALWPSQPAYLHVWLEKDALSGIFDDALRDYNVPYNVGRGYDGWSSIHDASQRYKLINKPLTILYFGDFDPSGEDMVRSLRERLADRGCTPTIIKVALTEDDIARYNLPPNFTKKSDSRSKKHIEKHGDISVELDALPPNVLRARLVHEVEQHLDMAALRRVREQEIEDRAALAERVQRI
jgi:hypothetical protein